MAHVVVYPRVGFFFTLIEKVPIEDRKAVKLALKDKIEEIDPVLDPFDPADTARYKWDSMTPVSADHDGHIEESDVRDYLQVQLEELPGDIYYAYGVQTEWCYVVRGGEIYCYHCYELTIIELVNGQPVKQPIRVNVVVYDDPDGNPYDIPRQYRIPLSVTYSWMAPF